jgi:hypothetical protein
MILRNFSIPEVIQMQFILVGKIATCFVKIVKGNREFFGPYFDCIKSEDMLEQKFPFLN